jgi:hypothetical protein
MCFRHAVLALLICGFMTIAGRGFVSPAAAAATRPITEAERAVGQAWIDAALRNDAAAFKRVFDTNALIDRIARGIELPPAVMNDLRRGRGRLADNFLAGVLLDPDDLQYQLLDHTGGPGMEGTLILRLTTSTALGYHGLVLSDDGNRVVDVFASMTGELMSTTARTNLAVALLAEEQGRAAPALVVMQQIEQATMTGNTARVRQLYEGFNGDHMKPARLMYLNALVDQAVQTGEIGEAYTRHLQWFRDNGGLVMAESSAADAAVLRGDLEGAIRHHDAMAAAVGGDPYVHVLHTNSLFQLGEPEAAREHLAQAMQQLPGHIETWWHAGNIGLALDDHDLTLRALRQLRDQFGVEFDDLSQVPVYEAFSKSPQHLEWLLDRE